MNRPIEDQHCYTCKEPITPEIDGVCINEGESAEMFLCDDCHYSEFGHYLWPHLLIYNRQPKRHTQHEN